MDELVTADAGLWSQPHLRLIAQRFKHDPQFAACWGGSADPEWVADLDRGIIRPEPPIKGAPPRLALTAEPALAGCMQIALRHASGWLWWHHDRAVARGLVDASDGLARAADAFSGMCGVVERCGMRVSAGWMAERVFDAVCNTAFRYAIKGGKHDAADDQYRDVTADHGLRNAVHAIGHIASLAVSMRTGTMDDIEASNAAVSVIVNLPEVPAITGSSCNE